MSKAALAGRPGILLIPALVLMLGSVATTAGAQIRSEIYVSGLALPLDFVQDPSDPSLQYVVEQGGHIKVVRSGMLQATDFLDLSGVISTGGERGLLGLAFPRDYATSLRFYVDFTNPAGDTVVARFKRSAANPLVADPASRFDFRWGGPGGPGAIAQPFANHNGGNLVFGPDGFLYIGMGDGGSGDDPGNRAQDPNTLLGKMLRIDVSVPDANPQGYRVPPDNPFLDGSPVVALPEIWAFGLRNPWRYSFDDPARGGTGALVIGDVGQGTFEEIDYEPAGAGGRNYGWRVREGAHPNPDIPPSTPAYLPLTDPIHEYQHPTGVSITGGFVYRGSSLGSQFTGRYFYADLNGRVWSIALSIDPVTHEATATDEREHTAELGGAAALGNITSFGVDASGELYLVNYAAGQVLRVTGPPSLVVTKTGAGAGTVTANPPVLNCGNSCTATVPAGTVVTLVPQAAPGSVFVGWGGDAACLTGQVTVAAPTACVAVFQLAAVARSPRSLDLDGNGTGDVFWYNPASGAWAMALADGGGTFNMVQGSWSPQWTIVPAHLNADSLVDLFLYNATTGGWFQVINTGMGGFTYTSGSFSPGWRVTAGHFRPGGVDDLLLYNPVAGGAVMADVDGSGGFSGLHPLGWSPGWDVRAVDLNGDGLDDVFLYNAGTGGSFASLNIGPALFNYRPGTWSPGWTVSVGDLDGDRRGDIFLYNVSTGVWFTCLSTGDGAFRYQAGQWSPDWQILIGRFTADNADDVFLYNVSSGTWFQALSDRLGGFDQYVTGTFSPGWTMATADVNNDGIDDIILSDPGTGVYFQCLTGTAGGFARFVKGSVQPGFQMVATPPPSGQR